MQSSMAIRLQWFTGSGGPLLLLPEDLLDGWSGIDPPIDGRVVQVERRWDPDHPATDYDRACEVDTAIANLPVGSGRGIVLAGEPQSTAVVPRPWGVVLVRCDATPSEDVVLRWVEALESGEATGTPATIEAHPGPLWLFDAACPGPEVEQDRLVLDVHPGRYLADSHEIVTDGEDRAVLIRLERVG